MDELIQLLKKVINIVDESDGVSGYHLNGDIAYWNEFPEIDEVRRILNEYPCKDMEDAIPVIVEVYPFEEFWNDYDKKVGEKGKLQKKWAKIPDKERVRIKEYLPKYIQSQPDKKYRKNPETFLNNKSWNDELIYTERKSITDDYKQSVFGRLQSFGNPKAI